MMHFKLCLRCNGDVILKQDTYGSFYQCLHCGNIMELDFVHTLVKANAELQENKSTAQPRMLESHYGPDRQARLPRLCGTSKAIYINLIYSVTWVPRHFGPGHLFLSMNTSVNTHMFTHHTMWGCPHVCSFVNLYEVGLHVLCYMHVYVRFVTSLLRLYVVIHSMYMQKQM